MPRTQNAALRAVAAQPTQKSLLDVSSLILLAVLLAAGLILNMTVGNALATTGIKPQFIIVAYCLVILLTRSSPLQALLYGLISAAVIQISTSIPGLNFLTEGVAAICMALLVRVPLPRAAKGAMPLVATFITTLISGGLFAVLGTVVMGAALPTALAKVPIVLATAVFNAIVTQALVIPLRSVRGGK